MSQSGSQQSLAPKVHTLDNGLTVVTERLPYLRSVTVGVWIATGSAMESKKLSGISHFLEHLFFKGTHARTSREIVDLIESKGGHLNAFTTREYTCLYAKTLDTHVEDAIEILGDIVNNSIFCDLEKERNVVLEEIASGHDVPEDHIHDVLTTRMWPNHPLGRPIAGSIDSVSRIGLEDIKAYKDTWYQAGNMYVCIVGNFDETAVTEQVTKEFSNLAAGTPQAPVSGPANHSGVETIARDIAQNHLAFAFPGTQIKAEDRYVYDILSSALGGGSTSRLFEVIREKEGLAYAIYSFNSAYLTNGMLGVYAAIAPENLALTLDLCANELRRFREEPMSDDELISNREQLKGGLLLALEGTFSRMARVTRSLMYFGRIMSVDEILQGIDAVNAEAIQQLAQRIFTNETCAMAILGPENGSVPEFPL